MRGQWDELVPMMRSGVIAPPVGHVYPVEEVSRALLEMADRKVKGKTVLTLR
jgi:NADPH2:quinone reductase